MLIRKLNIDDAKNFSDLIVNMYSNLENLEWFSPMPYDIDNVKSIIENPRFYIIGAFENNDLIAVTSIDFKCGKLIGKIDFPAECDTTKLIEFGFTMVHSNHRGKGIMKVLVQELITYAKQRGYEWAFGKVNKSNLASYNSLLRKCFYKHCDYTKPIKIDEFITLSNQDFFSKIGKQNAKQTLAKYDKNDTEIYADYHILMKKL